jgi:alanyl-tRNA synthetase
MSAEELAAVEAEVNRRVRENSEVTTHLMSPDEAVEAGALALFGEKYGEEVRVVSMGAEDGAAFSTELCGGTHVERTGDIGFFKVLGEGAIAAGVRRVEALTGEAARAHAAAQEGELAAVAQALKAAPAEVAERVAQLVGERKRLERELSDTRRRLVSGESEAVEARDVAGVRFAGRRLDDVPPKDLKAIVDDLKRSGPGVYAVVAVNDAKASLVVGVTPDLHARLNAVDLVRVGVAELGGKGGGGRPDMAQGGGPEGANADAALAAIERAIEARGAG